MATEPHRAIHRYREKIAAPMRRWKTRPHTAPAADRRWASGSQWLLCKTQSVPARGPEPAGTAQAGNKKSPVNKIAHRRYPEHVARPTPYKFDAIARSLLRPQESGVGELFSVLSPYLLLDKSRHAVPCLFFA